MKNWWCTPTYAVHICSLAFISLYFSCTSYRSFSIFLIIFCLLCSSIVNRRIWLKLMAKCIVDNCSFRQWLYASGRTNWVKDIWLFGLLPVVSDNTNLKTNQCTHPTRGLLFYCSLPQSITTPPSKACIAIMHSKVGNNLMNCIFTTRVSPTKSEVFHRRTHPAELSSWKSMILFIVCSVPLKLAFASASRWLGSLLEQSFSSFMTTKCSQFGTTQVNELVLLRWDSCLMHAMQ